MIPRPLGLLIGKQRWTELAARQGDWPETSLVAPELTDLLLALDMSDRVLLFRALPRELAAEVFASLGRDARDGLLRALTDQETRYLLADMEPDDRTFLLGELPGQVTQQLLNLLSGEDLQEARQLLGYPDSSVGRLMTPYYLAVRPEWTVARAIEHVRERGREDETSNTIFVVDDSWRLLDDIPLQRLVFAAPDSLVSDLMDGQFVSLSAHQDREQAVLTMQRYDVVAL